MGGITDAIFGSSGSPSRVEDITPPEFASLRNPIADMLRQLMSMGGFSTAPGQYAAPLSSTEQSLVSRAGQTALSPLTLDPRVQGLIGQALGMAGSAPSFTGAEQGLMGQISQLAGPSALTGAASQQLQQIISGQGLSPDSNPFLSATIDAATRPLVETFQQQTMPGLRSMFTAAGQQVQGLGSSPFSEALALERTGLANAIGDVSTNIAGQNYQAERARQMQAALAAPTFGLQQLQAPLAGLDALLGSRALGEQISGSQLNRIAQGINTSIAPRAAEQQINMGELERLSQGLQTVALPRLIQQYGIDMGIEEFRRRQQSLLTALQLAGGLASPNAVMIPGQPGSSGLLGGLLSGFGAGVGAGF